MPQEPPPETPDKALDEATLDEIEQTVHEAPPEAPPQSQIGKLQQWLKGHVKLSISLFLLLCLSLIALSTCSKSVPSQKTYLIAIDVNWPSLALGVRSANMTAFCETLLQQIAEREKLKLRTVQVANQDLFQKLNQKLYAGVLSPKLPEPIHNFRYLISDPLYNLGQALVIHKSAPYTSIQEMKGKTIGIVKAISHLVDITSHPNIRFIYYDSPSAAFTDLAKKKLDGVILDRLQAHSNLQGLYFNTFKILSPHLQASGIHLILLLESKADEAFMEAFNRGLQHLRADGSYKALIDSWDLIHTEEQHTDMD